MHSGHALGLLGAKAQAEAHAVLGDHQADFAFFFVALVGGRDHLHAVFGVEVARLVVEHVGQVAERVFGVGHGRLDGLRTRQAVPGGGAGGFQPLHRFAAQGVELRSRYEARAVQVQRHVQRLEQRVAQA